MGIFSEKKVKKERLSFKEKELFLSLEPTEWKLHFLTPQPPPMNHLAGWYSGAKMAPQGNQCTLLIAARVMNTASSFVQLEMPPTFYILMTVKRERRLP